jgi:hypothetical protein
MPPYIAPSHGKNPNRTRGPLRGTRAWQTATPRTAARPRAPRPACAGFLLPRSPTGAPRAARTRLAPARGSRQKLRPVPTSAPQPPAAHPPAPKR